MARAGKISNAKALVLLLFGSLTQDLEVVQLLKTKHLENLIRAIFTEDSAESELLI